MTNNEGSDDSSEIYKNVQKMVKNSKKVPQDLTNDELALHIEFWMSLNDELTEGQKGFFEEVIWRFRMMSDKENDNE